VIRKSEAYKEEDEMITKTLFPGCYIQGDGAIERLKDELPKFGQEGLCIMTASSRERLKERLSETTVALRLHDAEFGGECSDREIDRHVEAAKNCDAQFIVAIGGGKTIDTGKITADRLGLPVVVVPTIASTDAPCSACAIVYSEEGAVIRVEYQKNNPNLVLVDSGIIANAPARFLVSGMGDALATWFEAESCRKNNAKNEAGELGSHTAYALSRICYDTLLEYGADALAACKDHQATPALEHVIEANTLLSGLGFESGGLAMAHSIHNGLTVLHQTHDYFHGEKVAMGVLASLFLREETKPFIDEVYTFCKSIGLPTTLAGIGLGEATAEELERVAVRACRADEQIHHEGSDITPEVVIRTLLAADAEGKRRKA
jgi:glycerol dehydrogenase